MSDQMPDEVWIESSFNNDPNWPGFEREVYVADDGLIPGDAMRYIRADLYEQAEAERDRLRQQAEIWAQEARTQRATVHECYQACTGATGEPGDWHGAEPVRAVVAERDRLRAAIEAAIAVLRNDLYTTRVREALARLEEALAHD